MAIEEADRHMTAQRISALISAALIATVAMFVGCQPRQDPLLPTELIGVWSGVSPPYADRFFQIAPPHIFFGTGDGRVEAYSIVAVEKVHDAKGLLFTVSYLNRDRQKYRFTFYYDPTNAGVIRFKHQQGIQWTKARS